MKNGKSLQIYGALIMSLGLGLSACQKDDHKGSAPNAQAQNTDGTGDVGGGNGINGKPLESYRVDVTQLEAYKKILKPKSDAIDKASHKEGEVDIPQTEKEASEMMNFKTWYIAPLNLKVIKNEILGLSFSEDKTEQLAAQTRMEVWISQKAYEKMDLKHQAELLMHEFFMGIYLWRFESGQYFCRIFSSIPTGGKSLDCDTTLKLFPQLEKPLEASRPLTELDYANIRGMTAWYMAQDDSLTSDQMWEKMKQFNFDTRIVGNNHYNGDHYDKKLDRKFTNKEILQMLQDSLEKGSFEANCSSNFGSGVLTSEPCRLQIKIEPIENSKDMTLSWKLQSAQGAEGSMKLSEYALTYSENSSYIDNEDEVERFSFMPLERFNVNANLKTGDKYTVLQVYLRKSTHQQRLTADVVGVSVSENIYHGTQPMKINDMTAMCNRYSATLNAKGDANYMLLKAKNFDFDQTILQLDKQYSVPWFTSSDEACQN